MWSNLGAKVSNRNKRKACIHGDEGECVRCSMEALREPVNCISLEAWDIERVVRNLDDTLRNRLLYYPEKAVIAGGYVRAIVGRESPRDVDIFVPNSQVADAMATEHVRDHSPLPSDVMATPYSVSTNVPGQLPTQFIWAFGCPTPADVILSFDFTVCQAAVWFGDDNRWHGLCSPAFYPDLAAKRLVYTSPQGRTDQDIRLIQRLVRYRGHGYHMDQANLCLLLAEVVKNATEEAPDKDYAKHFKKVLDTFDLSPSFEELSKTREERAEGRKRKLEEVHARLKGYIGIAEAAQSPVSDDKDDVISF